MHPESENESANSFRGLCACNPAPSDAGAESAGWHLEGPTAAFGLFTRACLLSWTPNLASVVMLVLS